MSSSENSYFKIAECLGVSPERGAPFETTTRIQINIENIVTNMNNYVTVDPDDTNSDDEEDNWSEIPLLIL
jgi:hypothetical protein